MTRRDDLQRVEQALTRISRVALGRDAARLRSERSGVYLSRPAVSILATLRKAGPLRLSELARRADLEPPLISREVRSLAAGGHLRRTADPTDGRAAIVELTPAGERAWDAYWSATEEIAAEVFSSWSAADLHVLAGLLERLAGDIAIRPGTPPQAATG
jgi:DNA-binding MarR family transcriptional regulator